MNQWTKLCASAALATLICTSHAQILIGQTAGYSGQVAAGVKETADGAMLYLDAVNAKGGVNGQKIELVSLDDKFDPKLAGENARKLIEEQNVLAMFLTRGTPHTEAMIPLLEKNGVALIGPSTGAMVLHQPVRKYIFNVRATYQREAEKAMTHLASMGMTRIAVVYSDDSFGADGIIGAQKGLTASKLTPVVLEKFNRTKPDFAPIAVKLASANAQAVLMVASGAAVVDAAQARAQEAAEKARRPGADFAALAREFSDAPEGKTGGELGLRSTDRYPELFVEALRQVPVGGVAGPVRSGAGFHVLKVLERSQGVLPATVLKNHVRHILLRTNPQQNEAAAAQRLADYRRRIERGEATFEALAREFSQDGSAKQGGDLGWAAPGRYVPEFEQVVESLQPGQISEPLVSRFGVHLVQLLDRREVPLTPREQRELARNALQEKKLEDAYVTWAQEQRARAYVELRDPPQ